MASTRAVGALLTVVGVLGILVYAWILFSPPREGWDWALVKLTVFAIAAAGFGVLAWMGYALATTPPPKPLEEIEREIEEEIKRLRRGENVDDKSS